MLSWKKEIPILRNIRNSHKNEKTLFRHGIQSDGRGVKVWLGSIILPAALYLKSGIPTKSGIRMLQKIDVNQMNPSS